MDPLERTQQFLDWWITRVNGQLLTNDQFDNIQHRMFEVCNTTR